jgi:hypothetical protein
LVDAWRGRQQREVDLQTDLQCLGDGCELTEGRVAAPGLQRGDHRLGDVHALGQLGLRETDGITSGADALSGELGVDR